jgi:tRNA A-37 threonylcarbamoyl transferase component Bud32
MVEPPSGSGTRARDDGDERPWRLGPFRVLERLGAGGMGEVFLAERREPVVQRVALKVIRADRLDRTYRARFEMEQTALARMDHPNIARLFDAGQDGEQAWFAMEYVPGLPLGDYCQKHRLSLEDRLRLFLQLCDGVAHAHMKGILHRDLKPANILVREIDGRPVAKIIDFGLAQPVDPLQIRATLHEGVRQIVGTFAYMSPEQAQRTEGDLDTRTDVYSLGVVLFELLVGDLPIDLDKVQRLGPAWFGAFLQGHDAPKPSTKLSQLGERLSTTAAERGVTPQRLQAFVRGELDWVTTKALARDRQLRYPSVRDLARDLERFLRHEPVEAGPPGAWYRTKKWLQRHARAVAVAVGVVAAATATLVVLQRSAAQVQAAEGARATLGQALRAGRLVERAEFELWPVRAAVLAAMRAWRVEATEVLAQRQELARLIAALRSTGVDDELAKAQLRELERGELAIVDLQRWQERIDARIERVQTIERRTVAEAQDRWQQVLSELREQGLGDVFADAEPGLLPLGRNPVTGLHEFYLVESAGDDVVPVRRDDGNFDVGPHTGLVFVLVPGGSFTIQVGKVQVARTLAAFLIARHEMTQAQCARLCAETWTSPPDLYGHVQGNDPDGLQREAGQVGEPTPAPAEVGYDAALWRHPVQQVSWLRAMRLLPRWELTLPTQAQWWWAANGAHEPQLKFAWLQRLPRGAYANWADGVRASEQWWSIPLGRAGADWDGFFHTAPVDTLAANPFGLHHVFGNCSELTVDSYVEPPPTTLAGDSQSCGDAELSRRAIVLGGSFLEDFDLAKGIAGHQMVVDNVHDYFGLRPVYLLRTRGGKR